MVGYCLVWDGLLPEPAPARYYAQIGTGATVIAVTLLSAVAGTWVYGYFREKLPH